MRPSKFICQAVALVAEVISVYGAVTRAETFRTAIPVAASACIDAHAAPVRIAVAVPPKAAPAVEVGPAISIEAAIYAGPSAVECKTAAAHMRSESTAKASTHSAGEMAAPGPNKGMIMMASVRIDDNIVNRLRNASSRDLIVEHVDPSTPVDSSAGDKKETAVYVVNPAGSPYSRLVADLHLVHR